jgi:hypothetical protein
MVLKTEYAISSDPTSMITKESLLSTTWTSLRIEEATGELSSTIFWEIGGEGLRVAQPVTHPRQSKKAAARIHPWLEFPFL